MSQQITRPEIFVAVKDEDGRILQTRLFDTESEAMAWALGRTVEDVEVTLFVDGREVWSGA